MKRILISALVLAVVAAGSIARNSSRNASRKALRKVIQLAPPQLKGSVSLEETLANRRSVRQYANRPVGFPLIGQLAWAGQGITDPVKGLRTAPSAGALYPIDLYFATPEGLFLYHAKDHSLEQTIVDDMRGSLGVPPAPCHIIMAGSPRKLTPRFRDNARTYMLLEAGHVAQNICLQSVAMGLGSVTIGGIDSRKVARACKLPRYTEAIYVINVGYPLTETPTANEDIQDPGGQTLPAQGKKVALIIPSADFRDDELIGTRRVLDMAGAETILASSKRGILRGMLGNMVEVKVLLSGVRVSDYDAIVFIGGPGVAEYYEDPTAMSIAAGAASQRKVLAAISAAPTVLANAGALTGKRATAFMSEKDKLQQGGAIFTGVGVERDGLIITCSGPAATPIFAQAIAEALAGM
ncbi:MAG: DJ-1/PfpI family protein [Planctomycetota bacterium]